MQRWTLRNGMKLVYVMKPSDSVALQILVNVGSNHETAPVRGISHFIEHAVFEGTKKRKNAKDIANAIERVGGDLNAYTTNHRTCFYVKVLQKHFGVGLDVLADILQDPLFRKEDVERQKNILFKEIDLVTDDPRSHQWVLFEKALFIKHPSKYPVAGTHASVRGISARDIQNYFSHHYFPKNMVLSVVGNVRGVKEKVERAFFAREGNVAHKTFSEPLQKKNRVKKEKRKGVANTYLVLGHRTVSRSHPDSYVLDVIDGILGRGQSGWMFDEIRNKAGLAYEVGTQHVAEIDCGFFATYASIDKKNFGRVRAMVLKELERLYSVSENDVCEAQTFLEGDFLLEHEDTQKLADQVAFWEQVKHADLYHNYVKKINAVSAQDVRRIARKYFSKPYAMAMIEGKK